MAMIEWSDLILPIDIDFFFLFSKILQMAAATITYLVIL